MISRRRCKAIAQDWAMKQGLKEYYRRMESIRRQDNAFQNLAQNAGRSFTVDTVARRKLNKDAAEMLLTGYYDPPIPKIPGFIARLRLNDWTPSMPTAEEWPMGTVDDEDSA